MGLRRLADASSSRSHVTLTTTRQDLFFLDGGPAWTRAPGWVDYDGAVYGTGDLDGLGVKCAPDFEGPPLAPDAELPAVDPANERLDPRLLRAPLPRARRRAAARARPPAATSSRPTRTSSPRRYPEHPSVWLLGGGSGHGFKHGPAMAERMAAALRGGEPMPARFGLGERAVGQSMRTSGSGADHVAPVPLALSAPRPRGSGHVRLRDRRRRLGRLRPRQPPVRGPGRRRVCLVEAGPPDTEEGLHIPVAFSQLYKTPFDWDFTTEPEPALDDRSVYLPRGHVLGGSSLAERDDLHPRQPRATTTSWARPRQRRLGLRRRPAATSSARRTTSAAPRSYHGTGGPLSVSDRHSIHPLADAFVEAATQAGLEAPNDDFNGGEQDGVGRYQVTQRNGMRCSTAVAYLHPVLRAPEPHAASPMALVTRVLFDGTRASGVEAVRRAASRPSSRPSARSSSPPAPTSRRSC